MQSVDRKFFDKYAIDPFDEEIMFDSFAEGWTNNIGNEAPDLNEFFDDEWDELE